MARLVLLLGLTLVSVNAVTASIFTTEVQTSYGPVRGIEERAGAVKYKSFLGIPYAAPPIGDLRFQAPQPPQKWGSVRNAYRYGNNCYDVYSVFGQPGSKKGDGGKDVTVQRNIFADILTWIKYFYDLIIVLIRRWYQSEDCLYLNVFTKQLGEEALKPVVVWIYGGGYAAGDGSDTEFGPEHLMTQDIVLVTFNYRLSALGFLSTNTSDAPGNAGLKDQTAALQWVHDNIASFGGDPEKVTIYGESSGGTSVHLHLLSPLSKGLFHRVIASSGAATVGYAITEEQEQNSEDLARSFGASQDQINDPAKRVAFLRTINPRELNMRMGYITPSENNFFFKAGDGITFRPVLEPKNTEKAFMTEHPMKRLFEGNYAKVPIMMGMNDVEGAHIAILLRAVNATEKLHQLDKNLCSLLPNKMKDAAEKLGDCEKVAQQMRKVYFDGKPIYSNMTSFLNLYSDAVLHGVYLAQSLHTDMLDSEKPPLYSYSLSFDGRWNLKQFYGLSDLPAGAFHADELSYVFQRRMFRYQKLDRSSPEQRMRDRLVTIIANFAKYGDPTPSVSELLPVKWEPTSESDPKTLHIDYDLKLEKNFLKPRIEFWKDMYDMYYELPK